MPCCHSCFLDGVLLCVNSMLLSICACLLSALQGIDIGDVELVIVYGFPDTMAQVPQPIAVLMLFLFLSLSCVVGQDVLVCLLGHIYFLVVDRNSRMQPSKSIAVTLKTVYGLNGVGLSHFLL